MARFYIAPEAWHPEALVLTGDEAHHCKEVMRVRVGDTVTVFNGEGTEVEVEVTAVARGQIDLIAKSPAKTGSPPARIVIAQAIPKGKNMDLIAQKATELGASEIIPLISDRTVVRLDAREAEKKRDKWQRVVLEACKQCGQNWLPKVGTPVTVAQFLADHDPSGLRVIAALHEAARPLHEIMGDTGPTSGTVLIGPEGDFTAAEMDAAFAAGFGALSLGPIVLRSETAAIYALSILGYELARRR